MTTEEKQIKDLIQNTKEEMERANARITDLVQQNKRLLDQNTRLELHNRELLLTLDQKREEIKELQEEIDWSRRDVAPTLTADMLTFLERGRELIAMGVATVMDGVTKLNQQVPIGKPYDDTEGR